jgi:hypothetical protein
LFDVVFSKKKKEIDQQLGIAIILVGSAQIRNNPVLHYMIIISNIITGTSNGCTHIYSYNPLHNAVR